MKLLLAQTEKGDLTFRTDCEKVDIHYWPSIFPSKPYYVECDGHYISHIGCRCEKMYQLSLFVDDETF